MGQPWLLFYLFLVLSNKQYNFFNKSMWKMSIRYTSLMFEPITSWTWVISHNNLTRAPALLKTCLNLNLCFTWCYIFRFLRVFIFIFWILFKVSWTLPLKWFPLWRQQLGNLTRTLEDGLASLGNYKEMNLILFWWIWQFCEKEHRQITFHFHFYEICLLIITLMIHLNNSMFTDYENTQNEYRCINSTISFPCFIYHFLAYYRLN